MEVRTLLATMLWANPAADDWDTASNSTNSANWAVPQVQLGNAAGSTGGTLHSNSSQTLVGTDYSTTGHWSDATAEGAYGGTYQYAPAGTGDTTATWQANGLAPGQYDVDVTWTPYSNRATNAPYQIYDGTTLIQTVPVNQQLAPVGTTIDNATFQRIATVNVSSGTLKVVLSNQANNYVIANAVLVAPASTVVDLNWQGGGITSPTAVNTDTNFTISRTYQISGAAPSADVTISYYASPDPTFGTANEVLLGTETITAATDKTVGSHTGTSPALQLHGAGTYYLYAVLDTTGAVAETDETNNVAQVPQTVVASGVSLVDDGTTAYSETGNWGMGTGTGYDANHRYASAGDGTTTATWQLTGLATGDYDVQVTWPAYPNRATNAPYRIYDGTTLLQTVRVNQQVGPAGTPVGGVVFQRIATVHVTSGTFKVVLGNDANGYVIADALRVAPASTVTDLNWTGGGITGPTAVNTDTNFTISRTYQISGAAPTSDFTISYYASPDATFGTANQVLLGTETITAAADKAVGSHTGTSPALQLHGAGTYYLYAVLDGSNAVAEMNETNNLAQAPQQLAASGTMVVDNGAAGYSESGTWGLDPAAGYGGVNGYAGAGDGTMMATWQVTGLATGDYDVQVTWRAYSNRATNAPYRIYDGTMLLQTVRVNQQVGPAGTVVGGVAFQRIATVHVASGTLKVVLGNDANGYVIADALRVAPASTVTDLNWTGGGITGPTAVNTDTNFTINRTYQISGAALSANFTISYYASPDATFGAVSQVLLGSETITAAADKAVGSHTGTSPALQLHGAGTYYLYAVLDTSGTLPETDETNNVAQSPQTVAASGALLIDNGTAGYTEAGAWSSAADSGYNSSYRYAAAGDGTTTATWQATGLATGDYDVQVTWPADPNRAKSAPYQVYDGATLLGTVLVNQQLAPVGLAYGGATFQRLGTFHVTTGTLKVVLGNNANGYVVADAARIAVSPTPTIDLSWRGSGVSVSKQVTTDTTFTVSRNYVIAGAAPATDFTIAYYASTDNTFGNSDDALIGTETIAAAVDKVVGAHNGTSPALQIRLPGTYTIFAKVDAIDAVRETNETNNVADASQTVTASGASFIDNVDTGYSEAGAWYGASATTSGYNGSYRYAPAGDGSSTATWQLGGLASGSYAVDVTWQAYANRATNATYSVYDGATLRGSVVVNQTQVPSGTSYTGVPFQNLGTFTISSGTLRVVLSNNANSWVIADAVRIAAAGTAPAVAAASSATPSTSIAPPAPAVLSSPTLESATLVHRKSGSAAMPPAAATIATDLTPVVPNQEPLPPVGGPLAARKRSWIGR